MTDAKDAAVRPCLVISKYIVHFDYSRTVRFVNNPGYCWDYGGACFGGKYMWLEDGKV